MGHDQTMAQADELAAELANVKAAEASAKVQLDAERAKPDPWWQVWATIADRTARIPADERAEVGASRHEPATMGSDRADR